MKLAKLQKNSPPKLTDKEMRDLWNQGIASGPGKYKSVAEIIAAARVELEGKSLTSKSKSEP